MEGGDTSLMDLLTTTFALCAVIFSIGWLVERAARRAETARDELYRVRR